MVKRQFRSTTLRRLKRKTPGGKVVIIYKPKKTGKHKCGICGNVLNMPYDRRKVMKLSKSERRPSRPYPMLCPKCAKALQEYKVMAELKFKFNQDINFERNLVFEKFLPVGWFNEISKQSNEQTIQGEKVA